MMGAGPASNVPEEAPRDEYVLSLGDLFGVIWKRLWVIVLAAVLLTGAAVGYSLGQTPIYEASIKILVGQEQRASEVPSQLGSDVMGLQQLTLTVSEAVGTRPVAEGVIERLDLDLTPEQFLQNLSVEQVSTTQFIQVSYRDPDPERAQRVANITGEVFSDQVSEVSPNANAITATLWERAVAPGAPASPDTLLNALLALVLGLMLGVGLAFLLEYLDDSWRSPEEVEQVSGVPTFGAIPEFKIPKSKKDSSRCRNRKSGTTPRAGATTSPGA